MNWDQTLKSAEAGAAPASNLPSLPAIIPAPELQTTTFPPVSWIVEGLLPEGITLFAGKPKLGKSWLALQIGYGIASGSEVLGRPAQQGSVLYAALEDNNRRLKHRMCKIAPYTATWPERLHFATEWPRLDDGGLDAFRSWVDATPDARLLIVDTLATVRPSIGWTRQSVSVRLWRAPRSACLGQRMRHRHHRRSPRPQDGCRRSVRYSLRVNWADGRRRHDADPDHHQRRQGSLWSRP
jgi:hypothetical protein